MSGPGGRRPRLGATAWPTYLVLVVLAVVYILPFLVQVATSFKTEPEAAANPLGLIPENWTTAAYTRLFQFSDYMHAVATPDGLKLQEYVEELVERPPINEVLTVG